MYEALVGLLRRSLMVPLVLLWSSFSVPFRLLKSVALPSTYLRRTFDVPSAKRLLRVVLMAGMMLMPLAGWGQTDYSGVYYISGNNQGQNSYNVANTTTNYYLCPTEYWIYYQATNNITTTDNGQPFITTYQYRNGTNDSTKAVWIIKKHPSENYYYIIHAKKHILTHFVP